MINILKTNLSEYRDSYEKDSKSMMRAFVQKSDTPEGTNVVSIEIDVEGIYNAHVGLSIEDAEKFRGELDKLITSAKTKKFE